MAPPSVAPQPAAAALLADAPHSQRPDKKQQQKEKQKQLTEALKAVQQLVKAASKEPNLLAQFPPAFASYSRDQLAASIAFSHAEALSEDQRAAVWALFEANMRQVYSRDEQKWSPKEKWRELFHEEARYLLVTDAEGKLVAYTHFRFEVEENLLEPEEMEQLQLERYDPVVYCYELQLDAAVHRRGLGKRLMQMLELVALKFKMHLVMLTVQKSNDAALAFYSSIGYKQHPSCPERNAFDDFDGVDPGHRIMFKDLRRRG